MDEQLNRVMSRLLVIEYEAADGHNRLIAPLSTRSRKPLAALVTCAELVHLLYAFIHLLHLIAPRHR